MKLRVFALIMIGLIVLIASYMTFTKKKEFLYAGTVEATEVVISSRLNAVIDKVFFEEGAKVKAGDMLVKLSVEDLEVAADSADRDYKRAVNLLKAGSMNQEAYDRIKFKRDDAFVRLGWGNIRSPIDGTVISRYREPGEMAMPGTKLLELADLKKAWAYVYVPQPLVAKLSVNMKVKGYVPESGMKEISGVIVKINDEAEFTPKNVQTRKERTRLVFGVKVRFENDSEFLKPGMTVEVKLPD